MEARNLTNFCTADFDDFAAQVQQPASVARLVSGAGLQPLHASVYLAAIVNEAHLALRMLKWARLRPGQRVLEVGAGAGLLTGYLQSRGIELTAIEPVGSGFEATSVLAKIVQDATGIMPRILPIEARELRSSRHGFFDLAFSVNVIEHFQPLRDNLEGMVRVMGPDGVQVHTCPNYHVPYEPHYGIPLVPFAPKLTRYLWARGLSGQPLWRSLNFITCADVRSYARRHGLKIMFEPGALSSALERLLDESAFAARHPASLRRAAAFSKAVGLISLLRLLPPALATPMTIMLSRT